MRRKKNPRNSALPAIIFFALIIGVILFSFVFKAFLIVRESKFERGDRFTVFVTNNRESKLISFAREDHSVSVIKIKGVVGDSPYRFFEIPIDEVVEDKDLDLKKTVSQITSDIIFKKGGRNLNLIDLLKMFIFSKTVSPQNTKVEEISPDFDQSSLDKMLRLLFKESRVAKEGSTIEVVNGTQEQGVGERHARLITNISGNVVLVSTGEKSRKSGVYYKNEKNYTLERLSDVLRFTVKKGKVSKIADITLVIGEDYRNFSAY